MDNKQRTKFYKELSVEDVMELAIQNYITLPITDEKLKEMQWMRNFNANKLNKLFDEGKRGDSIFIAICSSYIYMIDKYTIYRNIFHSQYNKKEYTPAIISKSLADKIGLGKPPDARLLRTEEQYNNYGCFNVVLELGDD